jgi:hypothetical protein
VINGHTFDRSLFKSNLEILKIVLIRIVSDVFYDKKLETPQNSMLLVKFIKNIIFKIEIYAYISIFYFFLFFNAL